MNSPVAVIFMIIDNNYIQYNIIICFIQYDNIVPIGILIFYLL